MRHTHYEEIRKTDVAILATAHNRCENQDERVATNINLKNRILREFEKRERPWFRNF
jgi:hypothetical protein